MGFRRHIVIDHGWDALKQRGWMRFRCNECGYEYRMWMYTKVFKNVPPTKPGGKMRRQKIPYSQYQIEFFAKYWGNKTGHRSDGCTVSVCKGCLLKRR